MGVNYAVLCHEVESVDTRYNRILLKLSGTPPANYPEFYALFENHKFKTYQDYFDLSSDFKNPHCFQLLYKALDLNSGEHYSNMANARGRYPPQEYADDIRQKQASKLAFR